MCSGPECIEQTFYIIQFGKVLSGILQDTVLGLLLFIVYINDILVVVHSEGLLLADDTKILRVITEKNDAEALQLDIDSLYLWSQKWGMEFNGENCHVLTLGRFDDIKHTYGTNCKMMKLTTYSRKRT